MLSSAAIIYLHMTSYASCIFVCGIDTTQRIPPSAVVAIRRATRGVWALLRESLECKGAKTHSAFFGCCQLAAAHGSILTIALGGESEDWNKAGVASDLKMAQIIMREQALRWPAALKTVEELKRLEFEVCCGIEGRDIQLMLGLN